MPRKMLFVPVNAPAIDLEHDDYIEKVLEAHERREGPRDPALFPS